MGWAEDLQGVWAERGTVDGGGLELLVCEIGCPRLAIASWRGCNGLDSPVLYKVTGILARLL
jgi:hypothetical protein